MNIESYARDFRPVRSLRTKYIVWVITICLGVFLLGNLAITLVSLDPTVKDEDQAYYWFNLVGGIIAVVVVAIAIIGSYIYYPTIRYEVVENEIHVYRGVITKTRKVVPYRTVTNLEIKQGIFDRFFGIGTVEVQTAGNSGGGTGRPEETIDGVPKEMLLPLQEHIISMVRNVTGSPGTSHDLDPLTAILIEIRDLKGLLKERLS